MKATILKIKLQLLQFQTDVSSARVAKVQALGSLRQLVGYASLPHDFDVVGDLDYQPLTVALADLQAKALASVLISRRRKRALRPPTARSRWPRPTPKWT